MKYTRQTKALCLRLKRMQTWLIPLLTLTIISLACGFFNNTVPDEATGTPQGNEPQISTNTPSSPSTPSSTQPTTPGSEFDKWSLWVNGPHLRGANVHQRRVYLELDGAQFMGTGPLGPPFTQQDFDDLAALGANYVNLSVPGLYTEEPPYTLDPDVQDRLDRLLEMVAQADMFAVISFRTGPGRSEFTFYLEDVGDWFDESYLNDTIWGDQAAQDAWVAMWRHTAQRYRDNPIVVGYDLMVEPNSNEVGSHALDNALDIWDPDEFYARYGGGLYDWNQLYPRITQAIRVEDSRTPILVGGLGYSAVDWLPYLEPSGDTRTVYTVHQYAPIVYTHQAPGEPGYTYPGVFDADWDGEDDFFDRDWLQDLLSNVDDFTARHGVPVAVNEFGTLRWTPGASEFMRDLIDLFETRGMNHALWEWQSSWEPLAEEWDGFTFQHGPDPDNHNDVQNDLQETIVAYWSRNTIRPSTVYLPIVVSTSTTDGGDGPLPLRDISYWGYQIQALSEAGAVDTLVASHYDMLVLEPTRTDWSSIDKNFDTKGMLNRLKASKASDGIHRKLVIAYIDIGEAEDWRWYWTWSTGWDCTGPRPTDWPDYILTCDPDGWTGNYPVAYWDSAWKDVIIYGQNTGSDPGRDYASVIDEAIRDGFDGIYLDWVEAFSDAEVAAAAQAAGLDPAVEMIDFIQEMRLYAAARNPNFIIIQQNAADLIDGHPELTGVIDAIAQEAIWFDGDASDDWNDPNGYDYQNDSDLVNYYLGYLTIYQNAGLPVFDCEYALNNANTAYANASARGYIPYATRRSLSQLTTIPPPGY